MRLRGGYLMPRENRFTRFRRSKCPARFLSTWHSSLCKLLDRFAERLIADVASNVAVTIRVIGNYNLRFHFIRVSVFSEACAGVLSVAVMTSGCMLYVEFALLFVSEIRGSIPLPHSSFSCNNFHLSMWLMLTMIDVISGFDSRFDLRL